MITRLILPPTNLCSISRILNKIIIFPSNRPPVASVLTPRPSDARVGGSAPTRKLREKTPPVFAKKCGI